jgi:hypothetical protein
MRYLLFYFLFSFKSSQIISQKLNQNNVDIEGLYKFSKKDFKNNDVFLGYIQFDKGNKFKFIGKTSYNGIGKYNNEYITYINGIWKVCDDGNFILKEDSLSSLIKPKSIIDSINFESSNLVSTDSMYFNVQIFDEEGKALPNQLIEINLKRNKVYESNSSGKIDFKILHTKADTNISLTFFGNEPFYPATLDILSGFNNHNISIFLKRIPENGFLQTKYLPINLTGQIIKVGNDFSVGKFCILTPVSHNEVEGFIMSIYRNNPYFADELQQIQNLFKNN